MSEEIANQSEESQEVERDTDTEALYDSFGVAPIVEKKDIEFPNMDEVEADEALTTEQEETEETETKPEKRTIKVKYLGEDKDVPEDEAPTWIQKGMNHDRLQEKLTEQQRELDELRQKAQEQTQQKDKDEYDQLRDDRRRQAEEAGLDPDKVEEWINNRPEVQKAKRLLEERETEQSTKEETTRKEKVLSSWEELFQSDPTIEKREVYFDGDRLYFKGEGTPEWMTPEMTERLQRGYTPKDAFELSHRDKIVAQTKKATEQKLIKQQQLGVRAQVDSNTATPPDETTLLPAQIALAEEFGVDVRGVQRQQQLIKNRR